MRDSEYDLEVDIVVICNDTSNSGTAAVLLAEAIDEVVDDVAPWNWPRNPIDGQWVDGSNFLPNAGITNSSSGTKLQFHPGDNPFTGKINKRLRLKAPIGTAGIGVGP